MARSIAFAGCEMTQHYDYILDTKTVGDAGEFEGYASIFGNVDQGGDVVAPGAFIEGVVQAKKDGRIIPMLWQHDQHEPIGVWKDIAEDSKGLFVKGQLLIDDDPMARRAHAHMKAKSIGGMSIGYRVPPGGIVEDEKRRGVSHLLKVDLREISLVTMPMNAQARFTSVKSILDAGLLPTVRQFDRHLRDAGFSKSVAAQIASSAAPFLRGDPEGKADEAAEFLKALLQAG